MISKRRLLLGAGAALAGALGLTTASCQSTSNGGSGGGASGPTTVFQPQGCAFKIAARPEYTDFAPSGTALGATPNIRRVRLGLGGNVATTSAGHADPSTTAAFGWQTDDGTTVSQVQWGTSPDPTKWSAAAAATGVTWVTPPGMFGSTGDERMHEAYVCGLTPATTYYYRVGGGPAGKEVWSGVYQFTTTPSDPTAHVRIVVSGDSRGQGHNAWQIMQKKMLSLAPTFELFSGDMINLASDQGEWEQWIDSGWKDASGKPSALGQLLILEAHGNHDNHTSLYYGNVVLPQDVDNYQPYAELFFSIDVGPVHVLVIDDAFIVDTSGDMAYQGILSSWLDSDLTAATAPAQRAKVPWIIAMHHHPEYSSSTHGMDADVLQGRAFFAPLWQKYHVDLAISGHDHDYERSKPLTGPTDTPTIHQAARDGTTYLVCAGAGADAYSASTSTFTELSHDFTNGGSIGIYSVLDVTPSAIHLQAHGLQADGTDPVFDDTMIVK